MTSRSTGWSRGQRVPRRSVPEDEGGAGDEEDQRDEEPADVLE